MTTNNSPDKERVTIILHSGAYDRASYALSLALVSLASGMEVHMLVTFEGLLRFTRGHLMNRGEETSPRISASIERGLASGGIQSLQAQLDNAKMLGLKIYACPNAMATLNVAKDELSIEVDGIMGLAAFLQLARTASIHWYI
ncbi:MAG: DsrE family protein [Chloroflexi bacterium]|nr:DsrE family protein [Chloroflexota bacterium]